MPTISKRLFFTFCCLFFYCLSPVGAQEIFFTKPQKIDNKVGGFDILGASNEGILVYKFGERYHQFEAYNRDNLQLEWSRTFNLPDKKARVIEVLASWDKFYMFYYIKKGNLVQVFLKYMNLKLKPLNEDLLITEFSQTIGDKAYEWKVESNAETNFFALMKFNKGNNDYRSMDYWLFNADGQLLLQKGIDIADNWKIQQTLVSSKGNLYFLALQKKRNTWSSGEYDAAQLICQKPDAETSVILQNIGLISSDFPWGEMYMDEDRRNNRIILGGMYSEKQNYIHNGYIYATFDADDLQTIRLEKVAFSPEMIAGLNNNNYVVNNVLGIRDLELVALLARNDGGIILINEATEISNRTIYNSMSVLNDFGQRDRQIKTYSFNDVLVLSIDPDGKLLWDTMLSKSQYSEGDNGYYASFGLMNSKDKLQLLFNDETNYKANVLAYEIDARKIYHQNNV
ncbi:MAG: hypothetical protein R2798_06235 [Chitinophagales bacterium]